jgi:hypothetical protein
VDQKNQCRLAQENATVYRNGDFALAKSAGGAVNEPR